MSEKTMVIAQLASQKMTQEYQMLTTKQDEEIATLLQRKKEEREKEVQTGDRNVTEIQVRLDKIRQETAVHCQEIVADGQLEVTKLQQQKAAVLSDKIAQATKDASEIKAATDVFEQTRMSEARLTATRNKAKMVE